MNTKHYIFMVTILTLVLFNVACKKSTFLDANPNDGLIIPRTLGQYQALLDNYELINQKVPEVGEYGADDYYFRQGFLDATLIDFKNIYLWSDKMWDNGNFVAPASWNGSYNVIFNANLVLHGLKDIKPGSAEQTTFDNVRGQALFIRAFYLYQLSQLFVPPYSLASATSQFGLPLRLGIDIDEPIKRSTIQGTYDQMIKDLNDAKDLLPEQAAVITRPSKHAVYALLSRIYLLMGDYQNSLQYANACLAIKNVLLDYNLPDVIARSKEEIIWPAALQQGVSIVSSFDITNAVDTNLISSYNIRDRRLSVFFEDRGLEGKYFKGSYDIVSPSLGFVFAGLATDEVYLIRAESYARLGNKDLALNDLNTLMLKRWADDGSWVPFTTATATEALDKILQERRKELVFRGLRWSDLRRLNLEGRNIMLKRKLDDGAIVTIAPNSLSYTLLIPPNVIGFHPEMPQNPR